jgi:hypothetical protein
LSGPQRCNIAPPPSLYGARCRRMGTSAGRSLVAGTASATRYFVFYYFFHCQNATAAACTRSCSLQRHH